MPLSRVAKVRRLGSGISSVVTSQGPSGPVPGKFLPQDQHYRLKNLEGLRGIQPDVWVKIPNGWLVVYEIWAQGEAIDKATYELFRIALRRSVRKYNIICLGNKSRRRWSKKKAYRLAKLVLDNVKGARLKSNRVRVAEVDLDELHDFRRAKATLLKQLS